MLDLITSCSSTTAALRRLWVVRHQPQSGERETLQTAQRVGQDPWRRFITHYVCLLWTDTSYRGDKYSPLLFSPLPTNSISQSQKYGGYSPGTEIARSSAEFAKAMHRVVVHHSALPCSLCCSRTLTSTGYIFSLPPRWPSVTWWSSSTSQLTREEGGCEQSH